MQRINSAAWRCRWHARAGEHRGRSDPADAKSVATAAANDLLATSPTDRRPVILDFTRIRACCFGLGCCEDSCRRGSARSRGGNRAQPTGRRSGPRAPVLNWEVRRQCPQPAGFRARAITARTDRTLAGHRFRCRVAAGGGRQAFGGEDAGVDGGYATEIEASDAIVGTRLLHSKEPDLDDDQAHRLLALITSVT